MAEGNGIMMLELLKRLQIKLTGSTEAALPSSGKKDDGIRMEKVGSVKRRYPDRLAGPVGNSWVWLAIQ
jgi:hypothetical protein